MSTHSLPSQAFHDRPVFDLAGALRRVAEVTRRWLSASHRDDPASASQRARIYASSVRDRDPRFAAELFAAADRHERLFEQ